MYTVKDNSSYSKNSSKKNDIKKDTMKPKKNQKLE